MRPANTRWQDDPNASAEEKDAARFLRSAEPEPWSEAEQSALWRRITTKARDKRATPPILLRPAFALAMLLLVGGLSLVWRMKPAPPRDGSALSLQDGLHVRLSPEAKGEWAMSSFHLHSGQIEVIRTGSAEARPGVFVLRTPGATIEIVEGRYLAAVTDEEMRLRVFEGEVTIRSQTDAAEATGRVVRAGEDWQSLHTSPAVEPPKVQPRPPAVRLPPMVPPPRTRCSDLRNVVQRRSCYLEDAKQDGLAAQNALYALGALSAESAGGSRDAERIWRESQRRFPNGALAPEVSLGLLTLLIEQERFPEAFDEVNHFLSSFPQDPRRGAIGILTGSLIRTSRGDFARALELLETALREELSPELEQDALWEKGLALEALGRSEEARQTWTHLVTRYPEGTHAEHARQRLQQ